MNKHLFLEHVVFTLLLTFYRGHQLGNSLAVLRQYYELGVRYVTLTHVCNNAFADSCGMADGPKPVHGGLRYKKDFIFVIHAIDNDCDSTKFLALSVVH